MDKFTGVSKYEMTPYLSTTVTNTPNCITCKINYHICSINCSIKKIYTLKIYIHPAERHRIIKFLFLIRTSNTSPWQRHFDLS